MIDEGMFWAMIVISLGVVAYGCHVLVFIN